MDIADPHDMTRPSWQLYRRLLVLGVPVDEATGLMNGYAHELAEQIRNAPSPDDPDDYGGLVDQGADWAADLIDPENEDGDDAGLVRLDEEPS